MRRDLLLQRGRGGDHREEQAPAVIVIAMIRSSGSASPFRTPISRDNKLYAEADRSRVVKALQGARDKQDRSRGIHLWAASSIIPGRFVPKGMFAKLDAAVVVPV
jgi:hypothetical protein